MDFFSRKLLSDDDDDDDNLKELCNRCFYHLPDHCPSDCLENCSKPCSYFPLSIPPIHSDEFNPTFPPKSPLKLSNWVTAIIALLSFTVLLVLFYTVYVRFYSRRRTRRRDAPPPTTHLDEEQHGPDLDHPIWYIRTVGLPPAVIEAIAVCKFKSGEGFIDGTECSVCLSEFEEDETLRLLPKCSHAFHLQCIDTWLRSHTNCPMCRAPVASAVVPGPPSLPPVAVFEETQMAESSVRNVEQEQEQDEIELGISDFQARRRSVSLDDSLSGVGISSVFGVLNEDELKKSTPNCSAAMNRSVSCSGKFFMRSSTQRSSGADHC